MKIHKRLHYTNQAEIVYWCKNEIRFLLNVAIYRCIDTSNKTNKCGSLRCKIRMEAQISYQTLQYHTFHISFTSYCHRQNIMDTKSIRKMVFIFSSSNEYLIYLFLYLWIQRYKNMLVIVILATRKHLHNKSFN